MSQLTCDYRPGEDEDWVVAKKYEDGADEWVATVVTESVAEMLVFCLQNSQTVHQLMHEKQQQELTNGDVND